MSKTKLKEVAALLTTGQQQSLYQAVIKGKDPREPQGKTPRQSDIAIIGLSGRYPGRDNHYDFWKELRGGTNFIREVPLSRWNHSDYYDPGIGKSFVPHKTRCKFGAFINNHDRFDAAFFEIQADEVSLMDPQERLTLETAWSCIEDAGYVPDGLGKEVGIFSGVTYSEYQKLIPYTSHSFFINGRIAYFFNFQGPAVTMDAGCCSSLAAIDAACRSLNRQECQTALVIGANIILHPDHYASLSSHLSSTTRPCSNPFGADDGWIPAEGVVAVLLKPLPGALQDWDHIYAVIKSSHVSQQGKTSWYGAFNPKQQAKLIRENFEKSGIHPETIGYVEAAANGSALGDAIEIQGLTAAFNHFTKRKQYCPIGTVKANVGHGEGVSTMLQLTKVLLQFKTKTILPLINLKEENPNIKIENTPFYFPTSTREWKPSVIKLGPGEVTIPRRAAISSFANGGSIGHLILEEHIPGNLETQTPGTYFIPLSSRTGAQLRQIIRKYIEFFENYPALDAEWESGNTLLNIMFTLCMGRESFPERVVFIAESTAALKQLFHQYLRDGSGPDIITGSAASQPGTSGEKAVTVTVSPANQGENRAWHGYAEQWVRGTPLKWDVFFHTYPGQRISLPTYCFDKQSFPIPGPVHPGAGGTAANREEAAAGTLPGRMSMEVEMDTHLDGGRDGETGTGTEADPDADMDSGIIAIFKEIFAKHINIPAHQIELSIPLEKYGFNSLMVIAIANELERYFSEVPKTLFFECQTIGEVIEYFKREYPGKTREMMRKTGPPAQTRPAAPGKGKHGRRNVEAPHYRETSGSQILPCPAAGIRDIAIIGLSGRYPQARNINEFWRNLEEGKDSITEIPPDRWNWRDYFHPDRQEAGKQGKSYSKWGGFLDDIDRFDPLLFNISPREAETMDPQERIFLQAAWEVLEDAGYTGTLFDRNRKAETKIKVGVYAGASWQEYQFLPVVAKAGDIFLTNTGNIANRVSYFFDFTGPSITLDTACSSSLTAIHLACADLSRGTLDMAIAGGVNLSILPNKYLYLSNYQFVSGKGRCESFGQGGDGYVPGEGVGCVLLKPLELAAAHRDHIYGIIRATAVNHGGRTNGYTVPNPRAQAGVIGEAIKQAGISPRVISYIEAHGTGTSLGDPIEIAGLTKVFGPCTTDKQYCAIGSVKSNIGHCESAAGIASVTKVLLQLKHRRLAPSLHSGNLNPDIDFSSTPFRVQQELAEWKRPRLEMDGKTREYPRIAGISAFGAGGANAHIIIEEYIPGDENIPGAPAPVSLDVPGPDPALIVLSAKNEKRLRQQVQRLAAAIAAPPLSRASLADIAYTLQVGREAMEERLAVIAAGIAELKKKLTGFLENRPGIENLHRGRVKRGSREAAPGEADEELRQTIDKWNQTKNYGKIPELWVKGLTLDWNELYNGMAGPKPRRISLPTYAFARERCWVYEGGTLYPGSPGTPGLAAAELHPLLHRNTSTLAEQRYSTLLTGREFFLAHHVIKGQRVLPGVVYLEMARAAVELAAGEPGQDPTRIRLENVVWIRPITVGEQPVRVNIGLYPQSSGKADFEIYTEPGNDETGPILHCRGTAAPVTGAEIPADEDNPTLDLPAIQARCTRGSLSAERFYNAFRSIGVEYGPGHRGIEEIYQGQGQVLAKLSIPAPVVETASRYVLHPALLDSALQAILGMEIESGPPEAENREIKPTLPFALEELDIPGRCASSMWAWMRYSQGSAPGDKIRKLDIDLCTETGAVCVRLRGFTARVLEGEIGAAKSREKPAPGESVSSGETAPAIGSTGTLMLQPVWHPQPVDPGAAGPGTGYGLRLAILCEPGEVTAESIQSCIKKQQVRCLIFRTEEREIEKRYRIYAMRLLGEIREILRTQPVELVLVQVVIPADGEKQLFAGLAGILQTARQEHSKFKGQLIEIEPAADPGSIAAKLEENSRAPGDARIRYQGGKCQVSRLQELENPGTNPEAASNTLPWKQGGVYLITGGAGGLGLIFAREILQQVKPVTLVLAGRSSLDRDRQAQLEALSTLASSGGSRVEYRQMNVTREKAVINLIRGIRREIGELNGIIHSAGLIRDNYILEKPGQELHDVLAPKVAGLVYLDRATRDLALDFFVLFSSGAGVTGNSGQADYAAANAFLDAYAAYRNALAADNKRRGQTLSIDWPLWKEGGMHVAEETETMLRENTGMTAMQTSTGIRAFYESLASGKDQVMVVEGNLTRMKQKLLSYSKTAPAHGPVRESRSKGEIDTTALGNKMQTALKQTVSEILKVKVEDIESDTEFNEYGFDSITITEFANQLNREYQLELNPTIFFEYPTIPALTQHLVEEHKPALAPRFAVQTTSGTGAGGEGAPGKVAEGKIGENTTGKIPRPRFSREPVRDVSKSGAGAPDEIAVIGMSGKFPMAKDLDEFWENLLQGKDCITEIPKDRWDWRQYWGDPKKEANKTNIKWGGFIEGVDEFDPLFFGISPREARLMDPQQRLLMTYVWKAIEDAGYSARSLWGTGTGIFVGTTGSGYSELISRSETAIEGYSSTGVVASVGPNRMSYFLNFHGPSEPVETACSSSLVAVHRAVGAINDGTCEMAIAGGVNTIVTPGPHISFNKAGMLCEDGRCKTFSSQANGYVRGEGVGMLFLKKLEAAKQAGDHIYGVIKATAENHGGRANSLTAPNPRAQAELLKTAYKRAAIHPGTVGYIEAHGTGTELGDPIEINGLKTAFSDLYRDAGNPSFNGYHCGLGSVKSNIGHLELAAGAAGLIKTLLQMKHKTLVKSLHCETINPYIQLENTPFYIVRENKEWKPLQDDRGRDLPRRAGVSSFGFGGANAHVVVEEYIPPEPRDRDPAQITVTGRDPVIIVLSAKNQERLRDRARQLLTAIAVPGRQFTGASLEDMAYTLQVGREPMEERLAIIVDSIESLREKLKGFLEGRQEVKDLYRGRAKREKETLGVFAEDEDLRQAVETWIAKRKYAKLLDLWVKGLEIDWHKLYPGNSPGKPRRISLPTYPFAKERYWVPGSELEDGNKKVLLTNIFFLHPLLHQNTSDLSAQRYSSTFTGREFFLADHIVKGQPVLPGVAHLEMVRAAVENAAGVKVFSARTRIENVVWTRPIVVEGQPGPVHIGLYPGTNGRISFRIYGETGAAGAEPVEYTRGDAAAEPVKETDGPGNLRLDINASRERCGLAALSANRCYEIFSAMGIDYGPGHRGIETLYVGPGQVLAKLAMPEAVTGTGNQFVLHPCMMDSALQALIGLMIVPGARDAGKSELKPVMPFSLKRLEIISRCTGKMWALVRYSDGSAPGDAVEKLDIDLCDEQGTFCIRMKELTTRVLEPGSQTRESEDLAVAPHPQPLVGTVMMTPVWDPDPVEKGQTWPAPGERVVIVGGSEDNRKAIRRLYPRAQILNIQAGDAADAIAAKTDGPGSTGPIDHIVWIAPHHPLESPADGAIIEKQNQGVIHCFRLIKALLGIGYAARGLGWTVITIQTQPIHKHDAVNPTYAGIHGLMGSMAKEHPNWKVRLIDLEDDCNGPIADIFSLPPDARGDARVYRGGRWYRRKLIPLQFPAAHRELPGHDKNNKKFLQGGPGGTVFTKSVPPGGRGQVSYRTGGVYVVIGGAGGIGEVWSEYMIRTYQARIIWIGRRQKDADIRAKLDRLSTPGPAPLYIAADAARPDELQRAYEEIKRQYSRVHGVIHSAIVLADQSLAKMEEQQFRAVLSAKVDVCVNMARVFQQDLDFVMFFSSMIAYSKVPGQSNYASACTFKDAFARLLAREWSCAVKVMNWGYWGNVGVVATPGHRERMARAGIGSIEPPQAMAALETLLAAPLDQMALIETTRPSASEEIGIKTDRGEFIAFYPANFPWKPLDIRGHMPAASGQASGTGSPGDSAMAALLQAASAVLDVDGDDIDRDAEIHENGFDRVTLTEFVRRLNRENRLELNPAIFYEHNTLQGAAEYLAKEHGHRFSRDTNLRDANSRRVQRLKSEAGPQIETMDRLLCGLLWGQLCSMGLLTGKRSGAVALPDLYRRWLEQTQAVLARQGYLCCENGAYTPKETGPTDMDALWKKWDRHKRSWLEDANMKGRVVLVDAAMRNLPEILTGKRPATEIMFPNSSLELVEGVYKNNPGADYFNEVLADTAVSYIRERTRQDSAAALRILEIGAGTGGTSAVVFEKIRPYRDRIREYCYTDISKAFLNHGEKEYGPDNPYLNFRMFDVEKPIASQNIRAGAYDIVIAANVLHATTNIRETLRNTKALLRQNGILLLNEMSGNALFTHLTFGLLPGWWLFDDPELRIPGCPGLYPKTWQEVLEIEGFQSVFFPAQEAHDLGQQVAAAVSDGLVRQTRPRQSKSFADVSRTGGGFSKEPQSVGGIKPAPAGDTVGQSQISAEGLREKSIEYIKKLVSKTLKIPHHKIDSSEPLEKYGIDSILVVELTDTLREVFDNITSTLFFEHKTIDELVDYFLETRRDSLAALVKEKSPGLEQGPVSRGETPVEPTLPGPAPVFAIPRGRFLQTRQPQPGEPDRGQYRVRDIAIIGLAGRYPLAGHVEEFWNHLKQGKNCIAEIPGDRWNWREYFDEEKGKIGTMYTKWGGFLKDIDKFDPLFFQISPAEAQRMDPQERLFLEAAYASIEDAGYTPANLCESRKVGVFAGVMNGNYPTGATYWSIANRISYQFNFQGPSLAVDTACSSSLTAIHLAMESLYSGMSECAVAGGVNLIVDPRHYLRLSAVTMLSSGDRNRAFGEQADGFVDGEAVGAILLKPLTQAIAHGDHIYGIIKGSMLNAGGKTNGYTVPNPNAQARLISGAFRRAGIHARTISYLEAHGTGTALGDPIEVAGLTRAFEKETKDKQFCALGSVKSNIGHCESAAGIAGVTKVLLQMKHGQLAPTLHSEAANPNIDFSATPFVLQHRLAGWKRPTVTIDGETRQYPRRAGISSFGAGGANAHLVIEEYIPGHSESVGQSISESVGQPAGKPVNPGTADAASRAAGPGEVTGQPLLIVLSAKNQDRLNAYIRQMIRYLEKIHAGTPENLTKISPGDMAYTLQVGREAMDERLALTATSLNQVREKLEAFQQGEEGIENLYHGRVKPNKETISVLAADEDMKQTIGAWITKRKYGKLLDLWVKGLNFDWNRLYGESKPRRISLPTYPFARERCWTDPGSDLLSRAQKGTDDFPANFCFKPVWAPVDLPGGEESEPGAAAGKNHKEKEVIVVIYTENQRKAKEVVTGALSAGNIVEREVQAGDAACIDNCIKEFDKIGHIIFLGGLEAKEPDIDDAVMREQTRQQGILALYRLVKSLVKYEYTRHTLRLTVITENVCPVSPGEKGNPYWAGLHGFCRAAASEYPDWQVDCIDISRVERRRGTLKKEVIAQILENGAPRGTIMAVRGPGVYTPKFEPALIPPVEPVPFKTGGVYLILGGAGGIGLELARYLAGQVQARLALMGRSPLDQVKKEKIAQIRSGGGKVIYLQADATNLESMKEAVNKAKSHFGPINGVFHSAIVLKDKSIENMEESEFLAAYSPKEQGSINLYRAVKEEPLDFMMFFSSANSFFANPGQGNYTAGCAFKDAFALYLNQTTAFPVKVINWGLWGSVGIAASDDYIRRAAAKGVLPIEVDEGMEAVKRVLASEHSQVLAAKFEEKAANELVNAFNGAAPAWTAPLKNDSIKVSQGITPIKDVMEEIITKTTGISPARLDPEMEWNKMGIDSISSMHIVREIETQLGPRIYPHELAEHNNLQKLTKFLENELKGKTSPRERPPVYIISTPRAGSTLLRVMLDGHSQVFAPPELHLLPFSSLKERALKLKENNRGFLLEGLVKAICELENISVDQAKKRVASLESGDFSVKETYELLRGLSRGRYVVDKSPSYAAELSVLSRAEQIHPDSFYIHLVRHPLSVMESFVRNRFDKLAGIKDDPWKYAGQMWYNYNANIEAFFGGIPRQRRLRIVYEDLVADPGKVMRRVCDRLQIDFEESMLEPYKGNRMTGGLHQISMSIGDPNFNSHKTIESSLADSWKKHLEKVRLLDDNCKNLAKKYNYTFDTDDKQGFLPAQESFLNKFGHDPAWHIVQHLSFQLENPLDKDRLEKSLRQILNKHAALRQSFVQENGAWHRTPCETTAIKVEYQDLPGAGESKIQKHIKSMTDRLNGKIDIRKAETLACGVFHLGANRYRLILVAHHLVSDGISQSRICKELFDYYHNPGKLKADIKPDRGIDEYQREIRAIFDEPLLEQHLQFWESHITPPLREIPLHRKATSKTPNDISSEREYCLDLSYDQLGLSMEGLNNDMFSVVSAGLYRCLSQWAGTDAPIVAHRLHRRNIGLNNDYHDMVGWFAGDVPLKLEMDTQETFNDTVRRFRSCFEKIPLGGLSYEILANKGRLPRVYEVCPVRLNYQPHMFDINGMVKETRLFESPTHERLYLLDFIVRMKKDHCRVIIRYSKNRHKSAAIEKLVQQWIEILKGRKI